MRLANVVHIIDDILELILLIVTFVFPILMSLLPATVYFVLLRKKYQLRCDEVVVFNQDELIYGHGISIGSGSDKFLCRVKYSNISEIICDEKSSRMQNK